MDKSSFDPNDAVKRLLDAGCGRKQAVAIVQSVCDATGRVLNEPSIEPSNSAQNAVRTTDHRDPICTEQAKQRKLISGSDSQTAKDRTRMSPVFEDMRTEIKKDLVKLKWHVIVAWAVTGLAMVTASVLIDYLIWIFNS